MMLSFFFQAEDGIRDHCVTGVQTCALPISAKAVATEANPERPQFDRVSVALEKGTAGVSLKSRIAEIGRASCRERVEISGLAEDLLETSRQSNVLVFKRVSTTVRTALD